MLSRSSPTSGSSPCVRWILLAAAIAAAVAGVPPLAHEAEEASVRMSGRVDRVYTDQFFTLNDGRAGSDLPVFIPNPAAPPLRGDRVTVQGYLRPFDWAGWVGAHAWFTDGWGLMSDMLVEFDGRAVLVAHSVLDPGGRELAAAPGMEQTPRPAIGRTRGERKAMAAARRSGGPEGGGAAAAAQGGSASGAGGGSTGGRQASPRTEGGGKDAGVAGDRAPRERVTPAGDQPDRRTGESAGETSERGTSPAGRGTATGREEREGMGAADQAASTPVSGQRGSGYPALSAGPQPPGSPQTAGTAPSVTSDQVPGGIMQGERFAAAEELLRTPQAFADGPVVVHGTLMRRTGPRTVEIAGAPGSGAGVVTIMVDEDLPVLNAGERVFIRGRLWAGPPDGAAPGASGDTAAARGVTLVGRLLQPGPAATAGMAPGTGGAPDAQSGPDPAGAEVVAATARAIARDTSLFVGRRVSLVGEVAEVLGPHAFLVRDGGDGTSLRSASSASAAEDAVIVLVSDPAAMPDAVGAPVRVFGRVAILEEPRAADAPAGGRIDPGWLEGVDLSVFRGRPVIVADSVSDPALRPIGGR